MRHRDDPDPNGIPEPSGGTSEARPAGGSVRQETDSHAAAAFRYARAAMLVADHTGRIVVANNAFQQLTGSDREPLGCLWPDLLTEDDVQQGWELHRDALRCGASTKSSLGVDSPHAGTFRLVAEAWTLPESERPDTREVVLLFYQAAPEERLLRTTAELRTENSDTALWSLDLSDGSLSEPFGRSALGQTLLGDARTLEEFLNRVHSEDIARVRDAFDASRQGRDYEQQFRMVDTVGDERWLRTRARYLDGQPPRLVGFIDDVTDRVQLVRRLADRRRIEAAQGRQVTDLAAKLVSATTVDEVTSLLSDEFVPIFGGAAANVLLVREGALRVAPSTMEHSGILAVLEGRDATDTSHPMGAVVQDRQPRFFENRAEMLERFPDVVELLRHTTAQSWAAVPIFGDRRVALGVWQVTWSEPHHATPDERALMLTLAGLAGQALQRVSRQQAELELADAIQRRMLPPQIPGFADLDIATRYLPAQAGWRVCGDFYDVIHLPQRRVGLLVGDVQGHGVEAAAAMGQIRVAFRAYATNQVDPGGVLAETNRLLTETGEIVFATCGYLVLDLDNGEMQAAWAGQPPAVLATPGAFEFWEPETGPPVGVDSESKYPVTSRHLSPEETLLLCSDGLVESSELTIDTGLERVGQELQQRVRDVEAVVSALAAAPPAGRNDDIVILTARMRDHSSQ